MQNTDPSSIVGVFRDHTKANHAVEELKQAGFGDDQIQAAVVSLQTAPENQTSETTRIIVTVRTNGKDKQAFGILFSNGANNADLPPGMELKGGNVVNAQEETVDLIPEPDLEANFAKDSFFGEAKEPGTSDELGVMDNPQY
jgi:hypothetical protein